MLSAETLDMLKGLAKDATTIGVTTGTGLVQYNLEPTAKRLQPRPTPLRNRLSRAKSPNGPGLAVNWKAITATDGGIVGGGTGQYPGVSEGHRNSFMNVTEKNYSATFSALGKDILTTFEAQFAGQGFDDARSVAQISKLNALMISEEKMILGGNAGSGAGLNGFQLGTPTTPTVALAAGGSLTTAQFVGAAVVALTYWGLQFASVAGGVVTSFVRTNADQTSDTINGGSSHISAMSSTVQTTGGNLSVTATVPAIPGALGFAWYFDIEAANSVSLANAKLAAITTVPTYTLTANPTGTQTGTATGLTSDNSANALDFTGMIGVNAAAGYVKDLAGAQLTANGDGTIAEIETFLLYMATTYFLTPSRMYVGAQLYASVTNKILTTSTGSAAPVGAQRINFEQDEMGRIIGGTQVSAYRSKYAGAATGSNIPGIISIEWHPLLPDNVILFDLEDNPYPDSSIPCVRRIMTQQEYYSIQWPLRTRQWEIGTYVNETYQDYVPFARAMLTGVGHA